MVTNQNMKINFSGHPISGFEIAPLVGVNLPMESANGLIPVIRETLAGLPEEIRDALKKGAQAEVILPGMAPAASILLAEWHGQFGSFPTIRWAVRGAQGFAWPDESVTNLQSVRENARTQR